METILAFLPRLTGSQALLALLSVSGLWALYRAQRYRGAHPYDVRDMMMDNATGKASLNAHIIAAMAIMAIYVCVVRAQRNEDPTGLITIVLGTFVGARLISQGISAYKPPVDGQQTQVDKTERTTTTTTKANP